MRLSCRLLSSRAFVWLIMAASRLRNFYRHLWNLTIRVRPFVCPLLMSERSGQRGVSAAIQAGVVASHRIGGMT